MKEDKQMFFDMGMEDYKNGVPCRPFESQKLMAALYGDSIRNGAFTDVVKHTEAMKQWANGWVAAMMKATDEELRQAGILP